MIKVDEVTLRRTARRMVRFAGVAANEDDSFDSRNPPRDPDLRALVQATPGLTYSRVFPKFAMNDMNRPVERDDLAELIARAKGRKADYVPPVFGAYYYADPLPRHRPGEHDDKLKSSQVVEALRLTLGGSPPVVNAVPNPYCAVQFYFDVAPLGTGTQQAWKQPGGDGEGLRVGDVEMVLPLSHEDLPESRIKTFGLSAPVTPDQADHATAVLGILMASDNAIGTVGGVPALERATVVANVSGAKINTADSIAKAAKKLVPGDVLLIEHQADLPVIDDATDKTFYLGIPAEYDETVYEAIKLVTSGGVIVVEAGGNGDGATVPVDFGTLTMDDGMPFQPGQRDSLAIVVSAAELEVGGNENKRLPWAPFGARVDCYARGVGVATCRSSATLAAAHQTSRIIAETFGGTSAAAAIIAAVALQVQGILKKAPKALLTPLQMRDLFRTQEMGTPAKAELVVRPIRFMPDMAKIILHIIV